MSDPILAQTKSVARANFADSGFVNENASFLALLDESSYKIEPVFLASETVGSAFSAAETFTKVDYLASEVLDDLGAASEQAWAKSQMQLGLRFFAKNVSSSLSLQYSRQASAQTDGSLLFARHRDILWNLGVSGDLFDREDIGQMLLGISLKAIFRKGDEVEVGGSENLVDDDFATKGFAAGADFSFLYTAPRSTWPGWLLQGGLRWRDVGTTQFVIGKTSRNRRFSEYPNDFAAGLGLATPNIMGGSRLGLRLEYIEWTRDLDWWRKLVVGAELRLPYLLAMGAGVRGDSPFASASLRFPQLEVGLSTSSKFLGEGANLQERRAFSFEISSVF